MRRNKEVAVIAKAIKPYGYRIIDTKKHRKILDKTGEIIYSFPSSPSDGNFHKQVIRDLFRLGHINERIVK